MIRSCLALLVFLAHERTAIRSATSLRALGTCCTCCMCEAQAVVGMQRPPNHKVCRKPSPGFREGRYSIPLCSYVWQPFGLTLDRLNVATRAGDAPCNRAAIEQLETRF